jgi:30S ribosomal protein S31
MGKGDRKSRRGKIWRGTTGKHRPKKRKETVVTETKKKK